MMTGCGDTNTGYTSWTRDRYTAVYFGEKGRDDSSAPGEVAVYRVRVDSLVNRIFSVQDYEEEILIEGAVEDVEISDGSEEDDADED